MKIKLIFLILISVTLVLSGCVSSCQKESQNTGGEIIEEEPKPLEVQAVFKRGDEKTTLELEFEEGYYRVQSKIMQLPRSAKVETGKNIVLVFQSGAEDDLTQLLIEMASYQLQQKIDLSSPDVKIFYQDPENIYKITSEKEGEFFVEEKTGVSMKGYFNLTLLPTSRGVNVSDLSVQMSGQFEVELKETEEIN